MSVLTGDYDFIVILPSHDQRGVALRRSFESLIGFRGMQEGFGQPQPVLMREDDGFGRLCVLRVRNPIRARFVQRLLHEHAR